MGAWAIGAVPAFYTPFNTKSKPDIYWSAQRKLFSNAGARVIVTNAAGVDLIGTHLPEFLDRAVDAGCVPVAAGWESKPAVRSSDPGLIQYSSGTTGPRKGVALTHGAVLSHIAAYREAIGLSCQDRIASWLPLYHDMGLVTSFLLPLLEGVPVIAMDPFEWVNRPTRLLDLMVDFDATLCWLPNFAFAHIANAVKDGSEWDLARMRAFINCSEPCKASTFDRFLERLGPSHVTRGSLQVCYAAAENVFAITQTKVGADVAALGTEGSGRTPSDVLSSGSPVSGVDIKIVGDDGEEVTAGTVGEIFIRSPYMIEAYRHSDQPAVNAEGWYASRDHGLLVDGKLFVLGRKDDVIVTRGKNIFAHDVETALSEIPGLRPGRNAALALYSAASATNELALALEPADDGADLRSLRRQVVQTVESTFGIAPSVVEFVSRDWVAKTSSGKINRALNAKRLQELLSRGADEA